MEVTLQTETMKAEEIYLMKKYHQNVTCASVFCWLLHSSSRDQGRCHMSAVISEAAHGPALCLAELMNTVCGGQ